MYVRPLPVPPLDLLGQTWRTWSTKQPSLQVCEDVCCTLDRILWFLSGFLCHSLLWSLLLLLLLLLFMLQWRILPAS